MPPEHHVNKDFFKQLFMGNKKLLKLSEVKFIVVPKLDELSVKGIKDLIKDDKIIKEYFPDEFFKNKSPDRAFFFNVINTVYSGFLPGLIDHATKQRIHHT